MKNYYIACQAGVSYSQCLTFEFLSMNHKISFKANWIAARSSTHGQSHLYSQSQKKNKKHATFIAPRRAIKPSWAITHFSLYFCHRHHVIKGNSISQEELQLWDMKEQPLKSRWDLEPKKKDVWKHRRITKRVCAIWTLHSGRPYRWCIAWNSRNS